jgi:hypothetical protein
MYQFFDVFSDLVHLCVFLLLLLLGVLLGLLAEPNRVLCDAAQHTAHSTHANN